VSDVISKLLELSDGNYVRYDDVVKALQAMQGEAEPVAYLDEDGRVVRISEDGSGDGGFVSKGRAIPDCWRPLYTAPQPAVPEGYVLVPIDPNKNMIGVIENEHDVWGTAHDLYAALLSAAKGE